MAEQKRKERIESKKKKAETNNDTGISGARV